METYFEVLKEACKLLASRSFEVADLFCIFCNDDVAPAPAGLFNSEIIFYQRAGEILQKMVCKYVSYLLSENEFAEYTPSILDTVTIPKKEIGLSTEGISASQLFSPESVESGSDKIARCLSILQNKGFIEVDEKSWGTHYPHLIYKVPLMVFTLFNKMIDQLDSTKEEELNTECKEHRPCRSDETIKENHHEDERV